MIVNGNLAVSPDPVQIGPDFCLILPELLCGKLFPVYQICVATNYWGFGLGNPTRTRKAKQSKAIFRFSVEMY